MHGTVKRPPEMPRDVRPTAAYRRVTDFYSRLFAPGSELVHGTREIHPSPDGAIYVIGLSVKELEQGPTPALYRIDADGGRIGKVRADAQHAAISADGRLAATSIGGAVEIVGLDGDTTVARFDLAGMVEQLAWSPAGELGLLVAGARADVSGAEGGFAMQVEQGGPTWLPEVETGDADDVWRRVWIWDGRSASAAPLTDRPVNVWEFDWAGDGELVAICSDHHSETSWYGSTLRRIDRASGAATVVHTPADQFSKPRAAVGEAGVAFIEAVSSDRGLICGTLKLLRDGDCRTLPTDGVQVTDIGWQTGTRLAFTGLRGVETVIGSYDLAADRAQIIWASTDQTCGDFYPAFAVSERHIWATIEGYASPPALHRFDDQGKAPIRSFAAPQAAKVQGVAEVVSWQATDGLEIQGLLIRPAADAVGLPLLVDIHGGPIWCYRNRWVARYRAAGPLVERGFAVLLVNPRGSAGRGQDFARHVVGDMGGADTHDFLSGLDYLTAQGIVDPRRIVLTGSSYGGFMSSWLITQDSRFAAAIPISPVTNWYAQHYGSQIPSFDEEFLGGLATVPGGRHFQRSPIFQADRVRTPTLILSGALDKNTPPTQAFEFHQALLGVGATSILCTYPEAGHSLRSYPAYLDSAARVMLWAEHYAGADAR